MILNSCGSSRVYGNSWPRKMKFTFAFRSICLLVYVFVNVRCVYHFRVHESLFGSYFTIKYMYIHIDDGWFGSLPNFLSYIPNS